MKRIQLVSNGGQGDYTAQEVIHDGKPHLIVPVVMLVEGVHHGSRGPILYTAEELQKNPSAWNGVPVVINHPKDKKGKYVSANSPDVLERELVGQVFNTVWQEGKLKAAVFLDKERLETVSNETLKIIMEGKAMDVSVGVFTEELPEEGNWNGEAYQSIGTDFTPDHLALLPNTSGACSWDDGCGIRVNEEGKRVNAWGILIGEKGAEVVKNLSINKNKEGGKIMDKKVSTDKALHSLENVFIEEALVANEGNYMEILNTVQRMMDAEDNENSYHYLEALYGDYFIYRKNNRTDNARGTGPRYYRQSCTVDDKGAVMFVGDPSEVRRETTYNALEEKIKMIRTKFNNLNKSNMKKCEMVSALIQNEGNNFTEEDKPWLESLEDGQLAKLLPVEKKKEESESKVKAVANTNDSGTPEKVNVQEEIQKFFANAKTPEAIIGVIANGEMKEQLESGLAMFRGQKKKLIEEIAANSNFTAERLKDKSIEDLQDLHAAVVADEDVMDYSLGAYTGSNAGGAEGEDEELVAMSAGFVEKQPESVEK